jgi:hypothetical protein
LGASRSARFTARQPGEDGAQMRRDAVVAGRAAETRVMLSDAASDDLVTSMPENPDDEPARFRRRNPGASRRVARTAFVIALDGMSAPRLALPFLAGASRASRRKVRMLGFAVAPASWKPCFSRHSWPPSSALSDRRAPLASRIICVMTSEEMTDVPEAWRSVVHPRRYGMIGLEPVPDHSGNLAGCSGKGAGWDGGLTAEHERVLAHSHLDPALAALARSGQPSVAADAVRLALATGPAGKATFGNWPVASR